MAMGGCHAAARAWSIAGALDTRLGMAEDAGAWLGAGAGLGSSSVCECVCALHKLGTAHICDTPVGTHFSCRGHPDGSPRSLNSSPAPFWGSDLPSPAV